MRRVAARASVAICATFAAPIELRLAVSALDGLRRVPRIDIDEHLVVLAAGASEVAAVEQRNTRVPRHRLAAGTSWRQVTAALTADRGVHEVSRISTEEQTGLRCVAAISKFVIINALGSRIIDRKVL